MARCTLLLAWAVHSLRGCSCLQGQKMNGISEPWWNVPPLYSYRSAHCLTPRAVAFLRLSEVMVVELLNSVLSAREMCVYLHPKTMFLWPVLGAHIIIGAYLTFERALGSFSELWSPLQLIILDCMCSCVTKYKRNQHSFVWQIETPRGIRGKQENSQK